MANPCPLEVNQSHTPQMPSCNWDTGNKGHVAESLLREVLLKQVREGFLGEVAPVGRGRKYTPGSGAWEEAWQEELKRVTVAPGWGGGVGATGCVKGTWQLKSVEWVKVISA